MTLAHSLVDVIARARGLVGALVLVVWLLCSWFGRCVRGLVGEVVIVVSSFRRCTRDRGLVGVLGVRSVLSYSYSQFGSRDRVYGLVDVLIVWLLFVVWSVYSWFG